MNINVRAPFFLIQAAAKLMRSTGNDGSIVSIGSIAAYAGMPMLTAYCTSKGGNARPNSSQLLKYWLDGK